MTTFKLHLRPEGLKPSGVVRYCLENNLLGLGWESPEEVKNESVKEYLARHRQKWKYRERSVHAIMEKVKEGDLIWARDAEGGYLLGKALSSPRIQFGERNEIWDMYHVVEADILGGTDGPRAILDSEVPGSIKAYFNRRGSTFHKINGKSISRYSEWLFASKTGSEVNSSIPLPFLSCLDPYELEDLVVLYLQDFHNWRVILSSHSKSTPRYEVTLTHEDHGSAGVQVKHGRASLDAESYSEDTAVERVFLFAANGVKQNQVPDNVTVIENEDLFIFAKYRRQILPAPIRFWLESSEEVNASI